MLKWGFLSPFLYEVEGESYREFLSLFLHLEMVIEISNMSWLILIGYYETH